MSNKQEKPLLAPSPLQQLKGAAIEEQFKTCRHEGACDCFAYQMIGRLAQKGELMNEEQLRLLDALWSSIERRGGL